jgi:hypothetical protein
LERVAVGQPPATLQPMGLGSGHKAQRRRLEGVVNGGELGTLGIRFMELGFALCCAYALGHKINYELISDILTK